VTEAYAERRPWALITGASAGLGAEFARQYAARGFDLMLVARRRERLEALAATLAGCHGIDVATTCVDLADPTAPSAVMAALDARGGELGALVNNAGYGVPGGYSSHPWRTHAAFQQVLVNAVAELCYHAVPRLRARGGGHILNVASLAAQMPGSAGHTLYAPAKAWLVKFSECLAAELAPQGVRVMALCPGFTYTEFHDVNGMRPHVSRLPSWLWMNAPDVVAEAFTALTHGAVVHIPGRVNRLLALAARVLPASLLRALIASRERDFRCVD